MSSDRQIVAFGGFLPRRVLSARRRIVRAVVVSALLYWLGVPLARGFYLLLSRDQPLVIARAEIPGEWRFSATQAGSEPLAVQVCFWYWHTGDLGRAIVIDGDDLIWRRGSIKVDAARQLAFLYRGRRIEATFDCATRRLYRASDEEIDAHGNILAGARGMQ